MSICMMYRIDTKCDAKFNRYTYVDFFDGPYNIYLTFQTHVPLVFNTNKEESIASFPNRQHPTAKQNNDRITYSTVRILRYRLPELEERGNLVMFPLNGLKFPSRSSRRRSKE